MSGEIARLRPGATVSGRDGTIGAIQALILDPSSLQLTHLAVGEKGVPGSARLVPVSLVTEVAEDDDAVTVDIDGAQLLACEPFYMPGHIDFQDAHHHATVVVGQRELDSVSTFVTEEHTPKPGEAVLAKGDEVETSDGHRAGRIDEVVIDPASGRITAIDLRHGHAFGHRQIVVPSALIETVAGHKVTLNVTKAQFASLS